MTRGGDDPRGLPRVLIVSTSAFNPISGGGITLRNLFRGWPRDRLAVAHADVIPPDTEICDAYYPLGPDEIGWSWPLRSLSSFRGAEVGADAPAAPRGVGRVGGWARRAARLLLAEGGLRDRGSVSPDLARWVAAFRPQLIYSLLGSLGFVRLVANLARETGAPVAIHMMDDWPRTRYRGALFSPWLMARNDSELRSLLRKAALRLAISEPMAQAYRQRYGLAFQSVHNPVDLDEWRPNSRREWEPRSPTRIVYSGAVLPHAQLDSLVDVARAVVRLCDAGHDLELRVHTASPLSAKQRGRLSSGPAVSLEPAPTDEELPRLLSAAEVLLLPVNFDRHCADYVRYSFPTKLPAYLASGTPVLAYGPISVTQIRLAGQQGWGLTVTEREPEALEAALCALARDPELRSRLGRQAQEVAASHAVTLVRPRFRRVLTEAALQPDDPKGSEGDLS